jgi:hypothetical protein
MTRLATIDKPRSLGRAANNAEQRLRRLLVLYRLWAEQIEEELAQIAREKRT